MDDGDGQSPPIGLVALPHGIGRPGTRPRPGEEKVALGPSGSAGLLRRCRTTTPGGLNGRGVPRIFRKNCCISHLFLKKDKATSLYQDRGALEALEDFDARPRCSSAEGVREANDMMDALRVPLSKAETTLATELMRGSRLVEVPGSYNQEKPDPTPEPITLHEARLMLIDNITAPCKHECNVMKQIRHAKKALKIFSTLNPIKQTLLRATTRQCGLDSV
jgi:hypothetical protein